MTDKPDNLIISNVVPTIEYMSTEERQNAYKKAQSLFEDARGILSYSIPALTQTMGALIHLIAADDDDKSRLHGYTLLLASLRYGGATHEYLANLGELNELYMPLCSFLPTLQNLPDPSMRRDGFEFIHKLAVDIFSDDSADSMKTVKKITTKLFAAVEAESDEDAFLCGFETASKITKEWGCLSCKENSEGNNIDHIVEICVQHLEEMYKTKKFLCTETDDHLEDILNETIVHPDVLLCQIRENSATIMRHGRIIPLPSSDQRTDPPEP
jgi:hypothetical protein